MVVLAGPGTGCGGQSAPLRTPSPGVFTAFRQMAVQPPELGRAAVTLDSLERTAVPWIAVNTELAVRAGAVVAGSLPRAMVILAGRAG